MEKLILLLEKKVIILVFLFILLIFVLMIITIKLRIQFIDLNFTTTQSDHINKNYKIEITIYTLQKLPILKININNKKINKALKNKKINEILRVEKEKIIKDNINFEKEILKEIKKLNIELKEMQLKISIGTENAAITAFIIPIISTFLSMFLSKKVNKYNSKQIFLVTPVYINENLIDVEFSGIIQIKMIHIINTICVINKKKRKGDKNERTSHRRTYDYSYE